MSFRISSVLTILVLSGIQLLAQSADQAPARLVVQKKDYNLNQAYSDVFNILSDQNTCSRFYGGSRPSIIVLNSFIRNVKSQPLTPEVAFHMMGRLRVMREPTTGASYRLFECALVNTNGSFYQRRDDLLRKFPSDIGNFAAGSRPARALILLHELGHLIQGQDGAWLLPDDDHNGAQSKANTLRVQHACRAQLELLK
jgi:hypothetical protein